MLWYEEGSTAGASTGWALALADRDGRPGLARWAGESEATRPHVVVRRWKVGAPARVAVGRAIAEALAVSTRTATGMLLLY